MVGAVPPFLNSAPATHGVIHRFVDVVAILTFLISSRATEKHHLQVQSLARLSLVHKPLARNIFLPMSYPHDPSGEEAGGAESSYWYFDRGIY